MLAVGPARLQSVCMPRTATIVVPAIPYHVTQRRNRRDDVFFSDEDRRMYLDLLREYSEQHKKTAKGG